MQYFHRPAIAPLLRQFRRAMRRLQSDRRGNVLILMGFAIIPLTIATGMAIDYSRGARLQTKLNAAADAASLSAVANPMLSQPIQAACNAARRTFLNALQQSNGGLTFNAASDLKISITETYPSSSDVTLACPAGDATVPSTFTLPSTRTATATYTGLSSNAFGGVLGASTITIGGTATAKGAPITYIDYYILLDISQSMGIAATASDMQALFNRTKTYNGTGCVFGCHVAAQGGSYANDYLAHSMSPRINLRVDAAVSAIQTIISDAQDAAGQFKNIRIGVYTMNIDPTNGQTMTVVSTPTSDYATLRSKVAAITLGNNTSAGIGDTDYVTSGTQFYNAVPANGTGVSQSSPKNYTFLVADGVKDVQGSCTSGHCTSVLDPTNCSYFKAKSTVGVIYTTYLPIYNNNDPNQGYQINYQQLVLPFQPQIAPAMQQCASDSSVYYEANDGPALDKSMKALFASTLKSARLSQ